MTKKEVIVRPKKWLLLSLYTLGPLSMFICGYVLVQLFVVGTNEPFAFKVILSAVCTLAIVVIAIQLPTYHRFNIVFSRDGIFQNGIISKKLTYDDIEKVVVRSAGVEIYGDNYFNNITIGDLYINYEEAADFLANMVKDRKDVYITGNRTYIQEFAG
ncbi:MAG: hypothetical protein JJ953_13175 [Gracilimonas sp.]|uniref:hypothetical protein n=1 Tax=Gracilimonas TaxID=649462 RepID=UPI001B0EB237|nr:hypothetical protein [Gracilimonas sp.]MBO6587054.1 hypothetical protein [Gracilimonas sp.]MBO6614458.1 hypothetical protein [Gracilimonas sp.]